MVEINTYKMFNMIQNLVIINKYLTKEGYKNIPQNNCGKM